MGRRSVPFRVRLIGGFPMGKDEKGASALTYKRLKEYLSGAHSI